MNNVRLIVTASFFVFSSSFSALGADKAIELAPKEDPATVASSSDDARIAKLEAQILEAEKVAYNLGLRLAELQTRLNDKTGPAQPPFGFVENLPFFTLVNPTICCQWLTTVPVVAGIHPPLRENPSTGLCVQIEEGHFLCPVVEQTE